MEVKLRVLEGKNVGREIKVSGPKYFIGRADDCQLRPRTDLVSRHHCVILVENGFVGIRDFGSKNGTFVNDERIKAEQELKHGDRLTVGNLQFEVRLGQRVGGQKKPKVEPVEEVAVPTAPSDRDDDDLNLDEWFGADDGVASTETKSIDVLEALNSEKPHAPPADEPDPELPKGKEAEHPDQPIKVVGVSEKRAKSVKAASTQVAAEEALKNLLRGGR